MLERRAREMVASAIGYAMYESISRRTKQPQAFPSETDGGDLVGWGIRCARSALRGLSAFLRQRLGQEYFVELYS